MNLGATRIRLEALTGELMRAWDETKGTWRDAKAQEFEAAYIQELAARVGKATAALEKLDQLLNRVADDCK